MLGYHTSDSQLRWLQLPSRFWPNPRRPCRPGGYLKCSGFGMHFPSTRKPAGGFLCRGRVVVKFGTATCRHVQAVRTPPRSSCNCTWRYKRRACFAILHSASGCGLVLYQPYTLPCLLQLDNDEVLSVCRELAEGRVLPAGWSSGYDNQGRQYFIDEVLTTPLHFTGLSKQSCVLPSERC